MTSADLRGARVRDRGLLQLDEEQLLQQAHVSL